MIRPQYLLKIRLKSGTGHDFVFVDAIEADTIPDALEACRHNWCNLHAVHYIDRQTGAGPFTAWTPTLEIPETSRPYER